VRATLGRDVLGAKEIRLMVIAENIKTWYDERKRAEEPAKWANDNPDSSEALTVAHRLAKEYGYIKD
jgi:hypothetical protein